jgi:zona occludens toxin
MAINFVTGLPRHGKTLWTLVTVKDRAEREKREVYTCNVPGITIPGWHEIDHPDKWLTVPNGSIIVIDELQDFWGKGATGSKVPLPILELSKHGKRGIDFYFITQEPDLVHATPRSLCEYHYFVLRAFGSHGATIRKFQRMQLHPEKVKSSGELTPWRYPKAAFEWYKSADVHNIKRAIPWKVKLIPVAMLMVGLSLWGAFHFFGRTIAKAKAGASGLSNPISSAQPGPHGETVSKSAAPITAVELVASYRPRLEGLPHTAPRYDGLTKPTSAPFPAACVSMGERCTCYTQQATRMDVKKDLCLQIVKFGYFNDWQQVAAAGVPGPTGAAPGVAGVIPAGRSDFVSGVRLLPVPGHVGGENVPTTADALKDTPQHLKAPTPGSKIGGLAES